MLVGTELQAASADLKTIASIAVMEPAKSGKLDLDASAFALLPETRGRNVQSRSAT